MTRVNVIPPELLSDEWLLAEYREIKRIPNNVRSGKYRMIGIPDHYVLGIGHEKFFIDKLMFIKNRHDAIRGELSLRFNKEYDITIDLDGIPDHLLNDWEPGIYDIQRNIRRLQERFRPGFYHFCRRPMEDLYVIRSYYDQTY
ncbi:endonuclease V N-glycosylase UV repair enzyme [Vibrio phage D69]